MPSSAATAPAAMASAKQTEELRAELARKIAAHAHAEGDTATPIAGLKLFRRTAPSSCTSAAYEPMLVVFVQGRKRVNVGGTLYTCDGNTFQLTAIDVPAISQVLEATPEKPLLSMVLRLEMPLVREILSQQEFHGPEAVAGTRGVAIAKTPPDLLVSCIRLIDLLDTPGDIPFLGGLAQREIIYRLLRSSVGRHLRAIATLGDQSNRTTKAIAWLKENYAKPLRVEDLAGLAQMGVSTFHHRFRSLTSMSPLQYQKRLRLHQARVHMMTDGLDAASAAFAVGYESPSQFNREYRRLFGQPPIRDVKTNRLAIAAG